MKDMAITKHNATIETMIKLAPCLQYKSIRSTSAGKYYLFGDLRIDGLEISIFTGDLDRYPEGLEYLGFKNNCY